MEITHQNRRKSHFIRKENLHHFLNSVEPLRCDSPGLSIENNASVLKSRRYSIKSTNPPFCSNNDKENNPNQISTFDQRFKDDSKGNKHFELKNENGQENREDFDIQGFLVQKQTHRNNILKKLRDRRKTMRLKSRIAPEDRPTRENDGFISSSLLERDQRPKPKLKENWAVPISRCSPTVKIDDPMDLSMTPEKNVTFANIHDSGRRLSLSQRRSIRKSLRSNEIKPLPKEHLDFVQNQFPSRLTKPKKIEEYFKTTFILTTRRRG